MADIIERTLKPILKAHGYKKTRRTWHKEVEGVYCVFNLQKSQWSNLYYINLAVGVREIGLPPHPPTYRCHIQARLSHLVSDPKRLARYLDLEDFSVDDEERVSEIARLVEEVALPFLADLSNVEGIRRFAGLPTSKKFLASKKLREWLDK